MKVAEQCEGQFNEYHKGNFLISSVSLVDNTVQYIGRISDCSS